MFTISGLTIGACAGLIRKTSAIQRGLEKLVKHPVRTHEIVQKNHCLPSGPLLWSIWYDVPVTEPAVYGGDTKMESHQLMWGWRDIPGKYDGISQSDFYTFYIKHHDIEAFNSVTSELNLLSRVRKLPSAFEVRYTVPKKHIYVFERNEEKFLGDTTAVVEDHINKPIWSHVTVGGIIGVIADYQCYIWF